MVVIPRDCPCAESRLYPWKDQGLSAAQLEHRSQGSRSGRDALLDPTFKRSANHVKGMASFPHPPSTEGIRGIFQRRGKGAIDLDLDR